MRYFYSGIAFALLFCLLSPVWADAGNTRVPGKGGIRAVADVVLQHAPAVIRTGTELYCIRIELLQQFYTKSAPDKSTEGLIRDFAANVKKLGIEFAKALRDFRERGCASVLKKVFRKATRRGKKGRKARYLFSRKRFPPLRGIRPMVKKLKGYHRRIKRLVKETGLTTEQRVQLKAGILLRIPGIARAAASMVADAITFFRVLNKDEVDQAACDKVLGSIELDVRSLLTKAVETAFSFRALLSDEQRTYFLANLPVGFLLLR